MQNPNGWDIIFTSDAAGIQPLSFERERYVAATGEVSFWVKVPVLSPTLDTTIYLWYGNAAVSADTATPAQVWDSGYKGVWHLPNGTTLSVADSTSNGYNGAILSAAPAVGKIGGSLVGTAAGGSSVSIPSLSAALTGNQLTMSMWVNASYFMNNAEIGNEHAAFTVTGAVLIAYYTGMGFQTSAGGGTLISGGAVTTNTWYYVVGTYDGSTTRLYLNGAQVASGAASGNLSVSTNPFYLGRLGMDARMDEVRVSLTARSADWIATEYNNQNSPSTFYTVGSESGSATPAITSLSVTSGLVGTPVTITGTNLGASQGTVKFFNGVAATVTSWNATTILVTVPMGATTGSVVVTVGGVPITGPVFTVSVGTPTLSLPADLAVAQPMSTTLSWSATGGATSYTIYLDTVNPPVAHYIVPTGTSYTASLQGGDQYYWYVVGNSGPVAGPPSVTRSLWVTGAPSNVSVTPSSGGPPPGGLGTPTSFDFRFSSPKGWQDIASTKMYFFQFGNFARCFLEFWAGSGQLGLFNDGAAQGWLWIGNLGQTQPTGANNGCSVDLSQSFMTAESAVQIRVHLVLTFPGMPGTQEIYAQAIDNEGLGGPWAQIGEWTTSDPGSSSSLSIAKTHSGNFTQGQQGATYSIMVSNAAGAPPTGGVVTVTESVPSGMTLAAMSGGATWNCAVLPVCTTSSVLNGGSSYPPIAVSVNVATNALSPQVNAVSVSGGGSFMASGSDPTTVNPPVTVGVTPAIVTLSSSQTQQFTATVANTTNTAVTWGLSPNTGTISSTGLYTAPSTIASQQTVTVTATSVADTSKSAAAAVTLNPPVTVSVTPTTALLSVSQTQQFTATVTNTTNTTVTWGLSPNTGTISATGLYTAPPTIATQQTVTVTATSVADTGKSATAAVTLNPPISVSVTPTTASLSISQTQQFTATVTNTGNTTVTWSLSPNTGTISSTGMYTAPPTINSQQTVTVTATSVADITKSKSAAVTLNPPPTITGLSQTGAQITITGSGFGSQATGAVWLCSAYGAVLSWNGTQIVATLPSNATSGAARVRQAGVWSNSWTITVNSANISNITPNAGVPGATVVTITGSGFGANQGIGQVWLGTAYGVVQGWSDTVITAQVAAGSATGKAQVLQNNVWSNAVAFTMNTPQITSVSPTSGGTGTLVTFTGSGFGAVQGAVTLGSAAGQIQTWNDGSVTALVASNSVTGIARIQKSDGTWSNAIGFTVPAAGGNTVMPALLNMAVGDTRTLQALNAAGQPATGLTWTSSDSAVVSLSTDDPPVLTALAVGHVTIKAGTASADVTVLAVDPVTGALPFGTILWSNPGDGSGVDRIVPAVPSSSGVADVFAIQHDGKVQAITADGATAWTADVSRTIELWGPEAIIPDFQGGLILAIRNDEGGHNGSIAKLDGITGQPYPAYATGPMAELGQVAIHTDGTVFAVQTDHSGNNYSYSVIGVDPITGTRKFKLPIPCQVGYTVPLGTPIISGDGYAYVAYDCIEPVAVPIDHLMLLKVDSSGGSTNIGLIDNYGYYDDGIPFGFGDMITNADQGVIVTWGAVTEGLWTNYMSVTTGTTASTRVINFAADGLRPVLQAQDGSFVGEFSFWSESMNEEQYTMVAFDATGNVRWMVPNERPQIATADGGVIGQSGIIYDQYGNATGMAATPTHSWLGNAYQVGSVDQVRTKALQVAEGFWSFGWANPSRIKAAVKLDWFPPLDDCTSTPGGCAGGRIGPDEAIHNALSDLIRRLLDPAVAHVAQTNVFDKLGHDANGNRLTTASFLSYLVAKRPGLYDGSRSNYCHEALDSSFATVLCYDPWTKAAFTTSIRTWLAGNPDTGGITATPHNPFWTFLNPSFILYDNLGRNLGNEGTLFHEALHGITGLYDRDQILGGQLMEKLNIDDNLPSCRITTYIQANVLGFSGLNPAVTPCP